MSYTDTPLYRKPILLKGYHSDHNPERDYKKAKQACFTGFTSPDYVLPTPEKIECWTAADGWIGHLVPEGHHVIDVEDPQKVRMIRDVNANHNIQPPVNITNNGFQFCYRTNGGPPLTGDSNRLTRLGFSVTDRAAGKNYVINPPINGRTWENPEALSNPPVIPDELLPSRNNLEDTINELAWALGEAYRAGHVAGFEDIDAGFMDLLVGCKLPEKQIMDAFRLLFMDEYSERRTFEMLLRTIERKKSGQPMQGAATLVKKLKETGKDKIIAIIERMERLTGKSNIKRAKSEQKTILTAILPGLVDLVDDDGTPAFLMLKDDSVEVRRFIEDVSPEGEKIITQPPGFEHLPFSLVPSKDVLRHMADADDGLFDDVLKHLKRHAHLTDDQWLICTLYAFLTYLHDHSDVHYTAMLLFYAVPERGKTRTGRALTYLCYRGVHCVDLRETNLFRYSRDLHASLFLDVMDLWDKVTRNESQDVLLFRYERGATIMRVLHPDRGAFKDSQYYSVYGPTIMASNKPIHKILDTRCIAFSMPNKPGRYINPTPEQALPLRARLTAWRARHMTAPLPEVSPVDGIEGRLWDITQPLLQICKLVAPERYAALVRAVLNIATDRTEEKQYSDDGRLVKILIDMSPADLKEWDMATQDVQRNFNEGRPTEWEWTPHKVARRLKALGVKTRTVGGVSRTFLTREIINTLGEQYGHITRTPEESHESHENSHGLVIVDDLFHDFQHDFEKGKSNSCSNSCQQVTEITKQNELHELQDFPDGEEDIIIDVIDVCDAEVQR